MTYIQAQRLKVGDRVHFHADTTDQGTVIEQNYCAVKVEWNNGQIGVVRFREADDIHRLTT